MRAFLAISILSLADPMAAQSSGSPLIDYAGFKSLTAEVEVYRADRLVSLANFQSRAEKGDVLLLDARSAAAFKQGHLKRAINLPLPDFTADALAEVIGANPGREILIYCNNNFINNRNPVRTKALPLALNIQTFINLYGYGYKNIYELGEAVDMDDPLVGWISTET